MSVFSARPVIVVGAGVSGITAARALSRAGIEVLILEARDRIGGRTWTRELGGSPVDMGAMFIHGTKGNPVAELCRALKLHYEPRPWGMGPVFDASSGSPVEDGPMQVMQAINAFERQAEELADELPAGASLADAIQAFLDSGNYADQRRRLAHFALEQIVVDLWESAPVSKASLHNYLDDGGVYQEHDGGDQLIEGGYSKFVEAMATSLDIRLGDPVASIEHQEAGVKVVTSSGEYEGSHAIVTVPLGVLKAGAIEFNPPLPKEKKVAIERLDMGDLEKILLRFDEAFWREGGQPSTVVYVGKKPGTSLAFADFTEHAGAPTLVGMYGGQSARDTQDRLTDEQIKKRATEVLQEIFGPDAPKPKAVALTRWRSDPHARGSYSYLPIGSGPEDMRALAAPVGERLLFAGEATVPEFSGTVHGALLSGLREARRIGGESVTLASLR